MRDVVMMSAVFVITMQLLWQVDAVTEVFTVKINIMMRRKVVNDDIVKSLNAEGIDHAILTLVSENYT